MILIGLTGGIACGKSTVTSILHECGIQIIDCDAIVRELQSPDSSAVRAIARVWPHCVSSEGVLLRDRLGEVVFADARARRQLAGIMNWRIFLVVMQRILIAWWRSKGQVVVLDAPLLFETSVYTKFISSSMVVSCSEALQKSRLLQRNAHLSPEEADRRIAAQMPLSEKRRRAGFVVENNGMDTVALDASVRNEVLPWMRQQTPIRFPWYGAAVVVVVGALTVASCLAFL